MSIILWNSLSGKGVVCSLTISGKKKKKKAESKDLPQGTEYSLQKYTA